NAVKKVVHTHTYDNPVEEPAESGVHRVAARVHAADLNDDPAPAEFDDATAVKYALWSAITLLSRACARLERSAK
ncbi:MAG TPA: hypothetical protein VK550_36035, partial [Polyangiaceae bacterium]|nr:hypothetical protein [Polyangiaceae bacterium]